MSTFEAQPQQQQQQGQNQVQPVVVYPNPLTKQPGSPKPHHHSNGSFGTVFIVLAVIVAISAVACFLGRLCNRRVLNRAQKPSKHSHGNNGSNHGQNNSASSSRPKDQSRVHELSRAKGTEGDIDFGAQSHKSNNSNSNNKDGDIEFGFESMRSSSAPNSSMRSGSRGHVAFEKTGDHSKPHGGGDHSKAHGGGGGGGGKYYDYHGGPRASE